MYATFALSHSHIVHMLRELILLCKCVHYSIDVYIKHIYIEMLTPTKKQNPYVKIQE